MTAQDLRNAGYNVALTIADEVVTRFASVVADAYVTPIVGTYDATDGDQLAAVKALTYLALVADTAHATRAGGKQKLSPQLSERGTATLQDVAMADRLLRKLQGKAGAAQGSLDKIVDDVLHIYLRTYVGMN